MATLSPHIRVFSANFDPSRVDPVFIDFWAFCNKNKIQMQFYTDHYRVYFFHPPEAITLLYEYLKSHKLKHRTVQPKA